MSHQLDNWKQYLVPSDFQYLLNFVHNIQNHLPNQQILILYGTGNTGKTTLIKHISEIIGTQNVKPPFYNFNKTQLTSQLIHFSELHQYTHTTILNILQFLLNGHSVIIDHNSFEHLPATLLHHAKIITMTHTFSPS